MLGLPTNWDVKRQIIGVLDRIFPEYETLFSSIFIQSSRRLLAEAVSLVEFADCDLLNWLTCFSAQ
ncbi:MAG: hypothetical protein M9928_20040 [Anaerolineae bacterium]|nr:hypothetical protein [Anaerolineae bacterium]